MPAGPARALRVEKTRALRVEKKRQNQLRLQLGSRWPDSCAHSTNDALADAAMVLSAITTAKPKKKDAR